MRDYYRRSFDVDLSALKNSFPHETGDGEWKTVVERIATAYRENSSVRDSILGKHNQTQKIISHCGITRLNVCTRIKYEA